MKSLKIWAAAAAMLVLTGAADAALVSRAAGTMIYDTTRNITWLADMNYANTSGYTGTGVSGDGTMTWAAATTWANQLVFGGFDDWRLPSLNPADTTCGSNLNPGGGLAQQYFGYFCTGGELSGLFVTELGNKGGEAVRIQTGDTAEQIANLALFSNVEETSYWSGTTYAPNPGNAWGFVTFEGMQGTAGKAFRFFAVAVRAGDVAVAVPEPQTLALVLLALAATVVGRARRSA